MPSIGYYENERSRRINDNDHFYEQVDKELCNINTDLRQCEETLEEICGKLYIWKNFAENMKKEYAGIQMVLNPSILGKVMSLSLFIDGIKRNHEN